jgi:hypothetical protein
LEPLRYASGDGFNKSSRKVILVNLCEDDGAVNAASLDDVLSNSYRVSSPVCHRANDGLFERLGRRFPQQRFESWEVPPDAIA